MAMPFKSLESSQVTLHHCSCKWSFLRPASRLVFPRGLLGTGAPHNSLLLCPPRATDSFEPTFLPLCCLPRQLCLLASSRAVPQPHLRCPSASRLAARARERMPKPSHLLQVPELVGGWSPRGAQYPVVTGNFLWEALTLPGSRPVGALSYLLPGEPFLLAGNYCYRAFLFLLRVGASLSAQADSGTLPTSSSHGHRRAALDFLWISSLPPVPLHPPGICS